MHPQAANCPPHLSPPLTVWQDGVVAPAGSGLVVPSTLPQPAHRPRRPHIPRRQRRRRRARRRRAVAASARECQLAVAVSRGAAIHQLGAAGTAGGQGRAPCRCDARTAAKRHSRCKPTGSCHPPEHPGQHCAHMASLLTGLLDRSTRHLLPRPSTAAQQLAAVGPAREQTASVALRHSRQGRICRQCAHSALQHASACTQAGRPPPPR